MPFFKSDDIQNWTEGKWFNLNPKKKPEIHGFSIDSRDIGKDFAFVAIKGARDGHDFAADAAANGATAIIAERELDVGVPVLVVNDTLKALQRIAKLHRLRFENPVVGITGSCGKTSTKEMLAKLASWKNPLATKGNLNNQLGVPLTLTQIDLRQNQLAIVEAGVSAPGQMKELAEMIEPDIAIITNVGLAHLEGFSEVGNVAKEKAALAAGVAEGGWCLIHHNLLSWKAFDELKCKKAVVAPADAPDFKADLIFRYGFAQLENEEVAIDMSIEGGDDYYFEVPQMSSGMLENSLLAIAASLMLGGKEEQIAAKLETLSPLPMRGGIVASGDSKYYVDCYNASPTSMKDALAYFSKIAGDETPKLYVLGSMAELGLANHRHHREIGSHIKCKPSDAAVLIGESAEIYKSAMLENGWSQEQISVFANAEDARQAVCGFSGFVFVKGSRVCELEKSLPPEVLEAVLSASANVSSADKDDEEGDFDATDSEDPEQPEDDSDGEFDDEDEFGDNCEDQEDCEDKFDVEDGEEDDDDEREVI